MPDEDSYEDTLKYKIEVLMRRGFARSFAYNEKTGRWAIDWTPEGIQICQHIGQLFEVPPRKPNDLNAAEIADMINAILLVSPRPKRLGGRR